MWPKRPCHHPSHKLMLWSFLHYRRVYCFVRTKTARRAHTNNMLQASTGREVFCSPLPSVADGSNAFDNGIQVPQSVRISFRNLFEVVSSPNLQQAN